VSYEYELVRDKKYMIVIFPKYKVVLAGKIKKIVKKSLTLAKMQEQDWKQVLQKVKEEYKDFEQKDVMKLFDR